MTFCIWIHYYLCSNGLTRSLVPLFIFVLVSWLTDTLEMRFRNLHKLRCQSVPSTVLSTSPVLISNIHHHRFLRASQVVLLVKTANAGDIRDVGSIPGLGRSPGGGHGNPLQYSRLENPMDWGACWAAVHGVTWSRTRLKPLSRHALCASTWRSGDTALKR